MSNYTQATYFGPKDSLSVGDPNKRAKGTEIDAELLAISTAIATKVDTSSNATTAAPGIVELATNAETVTGTDTTRAVTPAGLKAAYTSVFLQKPETTTVTDSTTFINDPHLVTPSLEAGTYEVELVLNVEYVDSSTGGFKNRFSGGTATLRNDFYLDNVAKLMILQVSNSDNLPSMDAGGHGPFGSSNTTGRNQADWYIKAMLVITAPGTLQFQWAQYTAAGATSVQVGSWMLVRRVA
jgi:hypothetical protein